jgi:hypothetical protein
MTLSPGSEFASRPQATDSMPVAHFLESGQLESTEQVRRFELLRLAFFALKLRKLEQRLNLSVMNGDGYNGERELAEEFEFRRSLLRQVIFQQVLTLMKLDAREQALQIIAACRQ